MQAFLDSFGRIVLMPYVLMLLGVVVCVAAVKKIDGTGGHANLRLPAILAGLAMVGYGVLIHFTATH